MNKGLKQRLVGAVVLASIALILWPLIFSDTDRPGLDRRSQIPAMPRFKKYTVAEPERSANVEPVQPRMAAEPSPSVTVARPPEDDSKPGLDQRGLPESWVLQVASFSKAANAEELKRALQKKGYKAYTRSITTAAGKATRVYVGPRLARKSLLKDKSAIDKMFKVNSIVVKFEA